MNNHRPDNIPEPKASSPLTREMEEIDLMLEKLNDKIDNEVENIVYYDKYWTTIYTE